MSRIISGNCGFIAGGCLSRIEGCRRLTWRRGQPVVAKLRESCWLNRYRSCRRLVAACVVLVFNVLLFRGGPAGIPTLLAFAGGLIGALAVTALGLASLLFGIWGWQQAHAAGSSPALGVAGVMASLAGLVAWLIVAIDFMMILYSFNG